MCTQQKKVIGTQKIAIHELRSESGEADNTSNDEDQDASGDSENEEAPASSPVSMGNVAEEFDDDYEDGESPDTQEALHRLKSLESEKARFEGLLSDSQKEHQDLLERLNGMRSMMSMLGMKEDVYEDEGDAEDSGE